jgi:hypothetical protein
VLVGTAPRRPIAELDIAPPDALAAAKCACASASFSDKRQAPSILRCRAAFSYKSVARP